MKKAVTLFCMLILLLCLPGCSGPAIGSLQNMLPPQNRKIPIQGTWEVVKMIEGEASDQLLLPAQFSEKYVLIGNYLLGEPRYKIKSVNGQEYLLYSHKSFTGEINIPSKDIEIITITDKDKFFCEILRLNDDELILEIHNSYLYLKKSSDKVDPKLAQRVDKDSTGNTDTGSEAEALTHTGVMIGLRQPEKGNNTDAVSYKYRTLWIAANSKQLHPILEAKDIFFPRKSGFWKMWVVRNEDKGQAEDLILTENLLMDKKSNTLLSGAYATPAPTLSDSLTEHCYRKIDYVGNDYVSIESTYPKGKGMDKTKQSWLQILPIDSLPNIKGIKISDLLGDAGDLSMKSGLEKAISGLKIDQSALVNVGDTVNSFGLERRMGHWFLKGRINYRLGNTVLPVEYPINSIPPAKLILYDESVIPWTDIKDRVPGAVDAFSSPNKDIALIVTKTELLIYGINKGRLEGESLGKIALNAGETVVMAEWATGRYMDNWEKIFLSIIHS